LRGHSHGKCSLARKGGAHIDFNLPQIWRANTPDDRKLLRQLATPGLLDLLERDLPRYADGGDESLAADQGRTAYAIRILQLKRPGFMTFYLASLDHVDHEHGPFSKEVNFTLEEIDKLIGDLLRAAGSDAPVAIVSDHGFLPVNQQVNLLTKFREAGLIDAEDYAHVKSWEAAGWAAGASSAVLVNPAAPLESRRQTADVPAKAANAPDSGVARVLDSNAIQRLGGCPADFWVELKPGFTFGPSIEHGRALGQIDMRDIAPTLATIIGIRLEAAEGADLHLTAK
jgi:predicted AlkP superfamily pyrophosphatase or phosphodiesterase